MTQEPNFQNDVRLIVCPRPLSTTRDRVEVAIPAGATVAEHLRAVGCDLDRLTAIVSIDGHMVPRAEWEAAVPQAGQMLAVQAIPAGGGDGGGKRILAIASFLGLALLNYIPQLGGSQKLDSLFGNFGIFPQLAVRAATGGSAAKMFLSGGIAGGAVMGGLLAMHALIPSSIVPNDKNFKEVIHV